MRQRLFIMFAGWLLASAAIANNTITISTTEGAPDEEVTISISLENTDAVSSLQVSIPLDENLAFISGSEQLADRCGRREGRHAERLCLFHLDGCHQRQ